MTSRSASLNPSLRLFRDISAWMEHVILPAIIIFGLLGNGISFLVFIFSHLRRLSASVYLAALSLANAGYLICRSIKWAHGLGAKMLLKTDSECQTFLYLNYVFRFLSVWYVVSFTVERYIAVCQPFQRQDMCTPKRAKIVVTSLAILSFVIYSFVIWTSGVLVLYGVGECLPKPEYLRMWTFIYSVDTLSTLLVPSAVIIVLNIMIICAVYRFHRDPVRRSMHISCRHVKVLTTRNSSRSYHCCHRTNRRPGGQRSCSSGPHASQVKVTKMLVTVSSTFLLLNLPIHSLTIYHHIRSYVLGPEIHPTKTFIYLQRFFVLIHDSNFAVNFIIYNICGRNFRLGLRHLIDRIRYKLSRCGRAHQLNTTPATTLTMIPVNKMFGDPPLDNENHRKLQANGMHFKPHSRSRSTSSSSKSFVSMRGRHRMTSQGSHSYRWDPPEQS